MYCRIMKMPSALAAPGTYSARGVLNQPSQSITSTVGIMPMKLGSSSVDITAAKSCSRQRKSYMANAKPASEQKNRFSTVVMIAM